MKRSKRSTKSRSSKASSKKMTMMGLPLSSPDGATSWVIQLGVVFIVVMAIALAYMVGVIRQ